MNSHDAIKTTDPFISGNNMTDPKPSRQEAEEAVRTLLRWAGEDPSREGLVDTPARVVRAYQQWFRGYEVDASDLLKRTFNEVGGYSDIVVLKDIRFESFCEHHMAPIIGKAHIAYLPDTQIVGISKLARVVDAYSKRFQVQEKLNAQIAHALFAALKPKGVGVVIEGEHHCMSTRGVHKPGVTMVTKVMLGEFQTDAALREEFMGLIGNPTSRHSVT